MGRDPVPGRENNIPGRSLVNFHTVKPLKHVKTNLYLKIYLYIKYTFCTS